MNPANGVLETDFHRIEEVFAPLRFRAIRRPAGRGSAEDVLKKIAKRTGAEIREIEALESAGGRTLRIGTGAGWTVSGKTELIILGFFLGVAEDVVSRLDLLEFGFGRLIVGIQVGVIFPGKLPVGFLDFRCGGRPRHAQNVI